MVMALQNIKSMNSLPTPFVIIFVLFLANTLFLVGFCQFENSDKIVLYCLAAVEISLLSALVSSLVTYFVFLRKIGEIGQVLEQAETGNFKARVEERNAAGLIGNSIKQVNRLISTIEEYIEKLHELNRVGEELANALTRDEVVRIVVETVENQLDGKCVGIFAWDIFKTGSEQNEQFVEQLGRQDLKLLGGGDILTVPETGASENVEYGRQPCRFLYVPVVEQNVTTSVIVFSGKKGELNFNETANEFAGTLSRLIGSAIARIQSIHELTRAESTYRALFMTIQGGIFRVSSTGKFEDINPAFAKMIGYGSMEEMLGNAGDLSSLFVDQGDYERFVSTLEREGWVQSMGFELLRRDGTTYPAVASAHAVLDAAGAVSVIEGNVVDITERVLREEAEREQAAAEAASRAKSEMLDDLENKNRQLRETLEEMRMMQKQLLQSEKMATVGTMAGGVAHDLNNILAGSVSYPELLIEQLPEDSELRKPLAAIRDAGTKAVDIINDLLMMSKGTASNLQYADLNEIISGCINSLEIVSILELNPELSLDVSLCPEKVYLRCTPLHIQKALGNLISGGMETAGEEGRVKITVALQEVTHEGLDSLALQEGRYAVLTIDFSDPGGSGKHYERIFDPFYFSTVSGSKSSTTGLGFTVSWNLIQEHEGTVVAGSGRDGRSSFMIYLPVTSSPETLDTIDDGFSVTMKGSGVVLVVDDEPLQRDITTRMLSELGYKVYQAASGSQALEVMEKREIDLILLDMLMPPGMNGCETYERILAMRPGQKALIVSGFVNSREVEKTLKLGAGGVLKKPFSLSQLGYAVKAELG